MPTVSWGSTADVCVSVVFILIRKSIKGRPTVETSGNSLKNILWIIVILLVLSLASNEYSIVATYQQDWIAAERAATYQERVEEAQKIVDQQRDGIEDLISDYETAVYDNPSADRIAEQQLIAAEFQIVALQTLAIQNNQVIELLSAAP
jgi:Leucine-rich repeat (LRR) protein